MNGGDDPTVNEFVSNLLESVKRLRSTKVTKNDVVSSDILIELCSSGISQNSEDILHVRDLAMILITYSGFLHYVSGLAEKFKMLQCKVLWWAC